MVLVVARSAAEIEALRSRWEALYAACSTTIFQNFTWNLLAARAFGVKGLREHRNRLPEIVEARSTLEVKLAELAAARRTAADMEDIDKALEAMAEEVASGAKGAHGDELFHQAVTAAAHSAVLAQLMTFIAGMILETRLESLGQPGRPEQSLASHRKIADAIRAQDSQAAAAAMLEHIDLVSDVALLK